MNNTKKMTLRGTALLGAAAIAAGSLGLMASPAFAAPGDPTMATGTVTIHKLEQPAGGHIGMNDGSELTGSGIDNAIPLRAGFTVCALTNINLKDQSDWLRLGNLTAVGREGAAPVISEANTPVGKFVPEVGVCYGEKFTDVAANGIAKFDLSADLAYVVYESTMAVGADKSAQPTIITVPYPGKDAVSGDTVWNYNPHIYPKNTILGKDSTKNGVLIGDTVKFDIVAKIVALPQAENYEGFTITDSLSDNFANPKPSVVLKNATGDIQTLESNEYTLTSPGTNPVVVSIVGEGLKKLDQNIGGSVTLTIEADLVKSGDTTNVADVVINGKEIKVPVIDKENFFTGYLTKMSTVVDGSEKPLKGAEFAIFMRAGADCPANFAAAESAATATPTTAKRIGGTFTSGNDGFTVPKVTLGEGTNYCAYETKIPAGYKGSPDGVPFTVGSVDGSFVTIMNKQIGADEGDLPALPITGAAGQVLLLGGGAALLAAAGVLVVARRRKMMSQDA